MSTELEVVSKALTDIDAVAAGIADLKAQYGGVVYEVATTVGMEEAKAARLAVRNPRYEVERIRKAAKAPIIVLGKKLDAEAARIEGELLKIEGPIDQQIKTEEARKETERQAKIDAEIRRVAHLHERVAELRGNQMLTAMSGSVLISDHIEDLEAILVNDSFEELLQQAQDAKAAGLARLRDLHAAAVAHEAEQARIKAEREELARLREAQAVRDAEAQAAAKAERQRIADENEAAKKIRDEEEANLAAARADVARQQEELRKAQEPPKPAVTRRGVAVKPPSAAEMIDVLAKHYKAHPDTIVDWLRQVDFARVQAA